MKKALAPRFYPSSKFMMRLVTGFQAFIFKISKGYLWRKIKGSEICVISMKGAKTGKSRSIPLMLGPVEEGVVLEFSQDKGLTANGTLNILGTQDNPVQFRSLVDTTKS